MGIAPIVTAWADAGHLSLTEITPKQVGAALPESGPQRNWAEYGLRSLGPAPASTLRFPKIRLQIPGTHGGWAA
jgi:hypothetical protein